MITKIWKKACLLILIIACLFNIVNKIIKKVPFNKELQTSTTYLQQEEPKE